MSVDMKLSTTLIDFVSRPPTTAALRSLHAAFAPRCEQYQTAGHSSVHCDAQVKSLAEQDFTKEFTMKMAEAGSPPTHELIRIAGVCVCACVRVCVGGGRGAGRLPQRSMLLLLPANHCCRLIGRA